MLLSAENTLSSICWYYYWHIWKYSSIYIYNWIIGICYLLVATYIWWITFGVYLLLLILFLEIQNLFAADSGFLEIIFVGSHTYLLVDGGAAFFGIIINLTYFA